MGQGQLLAAGTAALKVAALTVATLAVATLTVAAPAQGPLYRDRWADLHLELLRERLWFESRGRDQQTLGRVAELLAGADDGIPFRPAAQALALLRGVECDEAFLCRAALGVFVLPEVVDPIGDQEGCRELNASMFLPYVLPCAGAREFAVDVVDGAGAQVWSGRVTGDTSVEDLRMARAHVTVPAVEFADGRYRLRVQASLGGEPPRATDPRLEHAFLIQRAYQRRALAAQQSVALQRGRLAAVERALLDGLLLEVNRAYAGEAFDGETDAVADLERIERALDNVGAGRPLLDGITGDVPAALPAGGDALLGAVLRVPTATTKRPLVVFAGGSPAQDVNARRPAAPAARTARWVARRLGPMGLDDRCQVAWLQSPGGGVNYSAALVPALAALHQLLPTDGRAVLVLELEAATAAVFAGDLLRRLSVGTVLVGSGAMSSTMLQKLGDLRLLGVPLTGHPSSLGLSRTADVASGKYGAVDWHGRFELLPPQPRPWVFGARAAETEIAAFVRAVLQ